ncbi:MAG: lytic murein transglycosylase [Hyphomicrobium sp.]
MRGASIGARVIWVLAVLGAVALLISTAPRAQGQDAPRAQTTASLRADAGFQQFLLGLWPEAKAVGVSRATFDAALRGLDAPDRSLPDLVLAGKPKTDSSGQAEFTRPPDKYLDKVYLEKLAVEGRQLLVRHKAALDRIEAEIGVDRYSVLAIWGRETAFGKHKLPHDAIAVLATQAYLGRRKELFRAELIAAMKMLESGVARADMRASWAGAVGLTQFMPTEYFLHAYDLDRDGKTDIFRSVPDALASAARQLQGKGWVRGQSWGIEVALPPNGDCAYEGPLQSRTLGDWAKLGFKRAAGQPFSAKDLASEAYLMSPAGGYGPSFLVFENYKVIRKYNTSDLYAVFVGHLADRIAGGGDFAARWGGTGPQNTRVIEQIQEQLKAKGFDVEKIDGKIGSNTRKVIGTYQRANRLKVDCWPSNAVLDHLHGRASIQ